MKNFNELTKQEQEAAAKLFAKRQEQKVKDQRYWAKQAILIQKAIATGITASEEEITAHVKTMKTRTAK